MDDELKLLTYGSDNPYSSNINGLIEHLMNKDKYPTFDYSSTPNLDVFSDLYIKPKSDESSNTSSSNLTPEDISVLKTPKKYAPTVSSYVNKSSLPLGKVKDWEMKVFNFFKGKGLGDIQSAAIVGNLRAESGGNPNVKNFQGSGATGLQQWLGPRLKKLKEVYGNNPSFDQQLEYLWNESSGKYAGLGWNYSGTGKHNSKSGYYQHGRSEFLNAKDIDTATIAWNQGFGRPGKHELANEARIRYAKNLLSKISKP